MSAELCKVNFTSATETPEKSQRFQLLRERQHQRLEARIDAVIKETGEAAENELGTVSLSSFMKISRGE